ncbi:MFS transporter [Ottowia pentelensis]|uniref:MFS transporter n=1 Tax=Ottowia pentelensis TaxID=511108 RepID=A0ABV6PNB8_9BURK
MTKIDSFRGRAVLMLSHVAGMVDMVALPLWVGTLVQHYKFDPQQAGGLVTLFLMAVALTSVTLAPRFDRLPRRWMATLGYVLTAVAFFAASKQVAFPILAVLHFVAGVGVGCGLTFTHGVIGRSSNPHRLFALVQFAVGVFGILFFGAVPKIIAAHGGHALFLVFFVLMVIAVVASALFFPPGEARSVDRQAHHSTSKIPGAAWLAIVTVVLLTLNQAMMFSYVERIGVDHGFGQERANMVLIAVGFANLFPAVIAAALQKKVSPRTVGMAAPILQGALALTITQSQNFGVYAAATSVYVFVMIFSHVFLFGLIARLDPSGRAVASTPAMVMAGSAIGPFLSGTLVVAFGYSAIGYAVAAIGLVALLCVSRIKLVASPADDPMKHAVLL